MGFNFLYKLWFLRNNIQMLKYFDLKWIDWEIFFALTMIQQERVGDNN